MTDSHPATIEMRLAELVAAFSLATDLGTGVSMESMLRVAIMAVHLGEAHGLSETELVTAFYLPLLALTGCSADAPVAAEMLGDETDPSMVAQWIMTDFAKPREAMSFLFQSVGKGKPPLERAGYIASMMRGAGRSSRSLIGRTAKSPFVYRRGLVLGLKSRTAYGMYTSDGTGAVFQTR